MAGLCEGGNEPPGSLKASSYGLARLRYMRSLETSSQQTIENCRQFANRIKARSSAPERYRKLAQLAGKLFLRLLYCISCRSLDWISTTKKGYIIDPTIRIETGSSQPEDVNKEKINIYLPTVDYFKVKYQLENIEVIGLLIGARGVIPKFFESFRKTFELPQTLTADIITSVLKRSCQILSHHIHSV
ncbi:hypothetical protein ANN_20193 [Periplaneta americana]|uniref:Uncharacterized protein n=1 Tax=Periplaneta americana TaxID=6978 RepID=A0ABQ8SBY8_PERAM|nr:hypothetical protein ANN_20193 [Periplaneta americana]